MTRYIVSIEDEMQVYDAAEFLFLPAKLKAMIMRSFQMLYAKESLSSLSRYFVLKDQNLYWITVVAADGYLYYCRNGGLSLSGWI